MITRYLWVLAVAAFLAPSTWAYDVVGTVYDPSGEVLEGALVWISQDRNVRSARTDQRGRFEFRDAKVGPIELLAWKDGYSVWGFESQVLDDASAEIRLAEPGSITIRVIDEQSNPLEGVRLHSLRVGDAFSVTILDLTPHGFPSSRSGPDGTMIIDSLPKDGFASFSIVHRNFAQSEVPTLPVGSRLDIRMQKGVRLRGRVSNTNDEPIERTRVSLFRGAREFTEVMTDAEGFYSARVPRGSYFVAARNMAYAIPDPAPATWAPGEDATVVDIVLLPPHIIHGSVENGKGEPVAGTRISYIARDHLFADAITDVTGRFNVTGAAGEGILRVTPPRRMFTVENSDILLKLSEERRVDLKPIVLASLPEITGRFTTRRKTDLSRIIVHTLDAVPQKRVITDAEGNFTLQLDQMPRGDEVRLRAEHAFQFLRRDFEVNLRRLTAEDVRLRPFKPDLSEAPKRTTNHMRHMVGKPAPAIECDDWFNLPEGAAAPSLDDMKGKVVVLTMWGGWDYIGAGPRRTDELNRLYDLYENEDDVVFINVHDASSSPEEVAAFARQYGIRHPVGRDADPTLTFDAYNVNTIPQTVLIDKQGILRYFHVDGRILELIKDLRRRDG